MIRHRSPSRGVAQVFAVLVMLIGIVFVLLGIVTAPFLDSLVAGAGTPWLVYVGIALIVLGGLIAWLVGA